MEIDMHGYLFWIELQNLLKETNKLMLYKKDSKI